MLLLLLRVIHCYLQQVLMIRLREGTTSTDQSTQKIQRLFFGFHNLYNLYTPLYIAPKPLLMIDHKNLSDMYYTIKDKNNFFEESNRVLR